MTQRLAIVIASIGSALGLGCASANGMDPDSGTGNTSLPDAGANGGGDFFGTASAGTGGTTSTGGLQETGAAGRGEIVTWGGGGTAAMAAGGTAAMAAGGTAAMAAGGAVTDSGIESSGTGGDTQTPGNATGGAWQGALSDGCAIIMHMDEELWDGTPGEVIDSCGHNNGTAVSGPLASDRLPNTAADGYFGRAGAFDDSNGCVQIPDDPSVSPTTQLTLAAWIFPTEFNSLSNGIIAKRADYLTSSSYTMFLWSGGGVDYQLWADIGTNRFHGNQNLSINRWYHTALVFDSSLLESQRVQLYINGVPDGEYSEDAITIPVSQSPLFVGCLPLNGPAQEFAGKLDEVAIWTRALGPAEVLELYQATAPL